MNGNKKFTAILLLVLGFGASSTAAAFSSSDVTSLKTSNACKKCDLVSAKLSGLDLAEADLSRARLIKAKLGESNLFNANLSRAKLGKADLSEANLFNADLTRANLSKANLTGASLFNADLTLANLERANLTGADLSTATFKDTKLDGVILCKTKMPSSVENSGC